MLQWLDERLPISKTFKQIAKHPVPSFINPFYCFGGLTFLCFLLQVFTGIWLAFYYKPTPEEAYASIQFIMEEVRFGVVIRSIHHYSANLMILFLMIHMARVYFTGSFKKPRELNWITGVTLFLITLGFGFTGYSLPWDQISYWAAVVGTEIVSSIPVIGDNLLLMMRGALKVGDQTLLRFYVAHVIFFPLITIIGLVAHFIMVRIQGISRPL